jgi:hypothetical protein
VQPPAEDSQEANAHLVGPVDVLPHGGQGLPSTETREKLADRLERVARIPAASARELAAWEGRCRLGVTRQLRQEPCQLIPPAGLERVEDFPLFTAR